MLHRVLRLIQEVATIPIILVALPIIIQHEILHKLREPEQPEA